MNRFHFRWLLLISWLAMVGQSPSQAGSPLPYPLLGEIENVELTGSSGNLGWEPIRGLDRQALEQEMTRRSRVALDLAGFKLAEPEEAYILITVEHAWDGEKRDSVALLVNASLEVLGQPLDASSRQLMHGRPTLRIWEERRLSLGAISDAREIILRELDFALERLAEERRDAQRR